MIVFPCSTCGAKLSADEYQTGILVRCPGCQGTMRVPSSRDDGVERQTARSQISTGLSQGTGRKYGFNCVFCSSKLEATESMAAQEGQCPTCGNTITIPILDSYGRLIDPVTREILKLPPHPVHAYAAAGERAPRIEKNSLGERVIVCPRCMTHSPVTTNNCRSCGMPFTMEGTTAQAAGTSNGFCVASLVLGIVGLPAFCMGILPILAIVFGVIGVIQVGSTSSSGNTGGKGLGIAGIICGALGVIIYVASH
jgi:DNA-directed RNA polymerase subunit RPC12/RpoP